jgi:hypothetical protein
LKVLLRSRGLLAVFACCLLFFVLQTKLPPKIVDSELPPLSLELDVGSPAEGSADGTFYWITKASSTLILANNTALPVKATLKGVLSVSPCSYEAALTIETNGLKLSGEIGPSRASYQFDSLVSFRPYERRVVKLYVSGRGCPTAPSDGRVILSKLSGLTLLEFEK